MCGAQLHHSSAECSQHFLFHLPAAPPVMTGRSKVQNPMTKYKLQELLQLIEVAACLMTPGLWCVFWVVLGAQQSME